MFPLVLRRNAVDPVRHISFASTVEDGGIAGLVRNCPFMNNVDPLQSTVCMMQTGAQRRCPQLTGMPSLSANLCWSLRGGRSVN
ncbi:hypothetical protein CG716_20670 [Mycolicibacterium sphagni]|uniref:Uncharacterized protein n=1 Tax=Mycolicibacterium sphagni TaxID=1786 RepID=A0A255DC92_9MYCO|nr:hypothetical protein CG716_20670 [Mycolicibacterium sphagni]